jgi:caa(3)-type oxidase subunit IV
MSESQAHAAPAEHAPTGAAHEPHDPHAPPHDAHEIEHHLKLYWLIGGVLFFFTLITVLLSYMDFDHWWGTHGVNMVVGLIVASFKVSLVGAIFMHLKGEKSTIWRFLYFTFFFFLGLFLLTLFAYSDPIFGTWHLTR